MLSGQLQRLLVPRRPKRFRVWQIDITTRCELACQMCIRRGLPGWTETDMDLGDFVRLVPSFDDVETVVLQGWGEPLLHPALVPMVRAAKSVRHPPAVGFVTSGAGLNEQLASSLIDAGLDFIGFSFAGSTAGTHTSIRAGSDYEELVNTVRTLQRLRERKRSGRPRVHMVFLLLRDNLCDLPELPRLARDLGIGEIILTNLIHVTTAWQDTQKVFSCSGAAEAEPVIASAVEAARALGIRMKRPSLVPRPVTVCDENPLQNLYITPSGEVSPCVYLHPPAGPAFTRIFCGTKLQVDRISFGKAGNGQVPQIWEGGAYRTFRDKIAGKARLLERQKPRLGPFGLQRESGDIPAAPEPPEPCRTCHKMLGF